MKILGFLMQMPSVMILVFAIRYGLESCFAGINPIFKYILLSIILVVVLVLERYGTHLIHD